MIVEEIFKNTIFPDLKLYVEANSTFAPKVTKKQVLDSKKFPIVTVKLLPIRNKYNNLNYGEETYTFGINIDIYAQDAIIITDKVAKKTICDEVTKWVIDYFKSYYHVSIKVEYDLFNVDQDVHRNNVRISGKLDTKYGEDNLVIYPR